MAKMNEKLGFLIVISVVFSLSSLVYAQNVTQESSLYDLTNEKSESPSSSTPSEVTTQKDQQDVMPTDDKTMDAARSNSLSGKNEEDNSKSASNKKLISRKNQIEPKIFERASGNLPSYTRRLESSGREFHDPSVETSQSTQFSLLEMKRGTVLNAVIDGDIVAYPDSLAPVTATVTAPEKYKRAKLLGTANLDTVTKRVNVEFTTMILSHETTSYTIKGITSDRSGKLGVEGVHKTDYWNWLWAEVLVRSSGGLIDASTEKDHSLFGASTTVTPENAAKHGVATGLNTMADRFGEKRSKSVDMTEVSGPIAVKVSITQ